LVFVVVATISGLWRAFVWSRGVRAMINKMESAVVMLSQGALNPYGDSEIAADQTRPVYILDDDSEVLQVLRVMISAAGWSVECFRSADEFVSQIPSLAPGIVVLDQVMGEMDGIDVMRRLAARAGEFRSILITGYPRTSITVNAMRLGAVSVMDKPIDRLELLPVIATASLELQPRGSESEVLPPVLGKDESYFDRLTPRERQVIVRVYQGETNKCIAMQLELSIKTVEKFRSRAMRKLNVRSLALLVRLLDRERDMGCRF
jgi:FixJ family two-component response regulator